MNGRLPLLPFGDHVEQQTIRSSVPPKAVLERIRQSAARSPGWLTAAGLVGDVGDDWFRLHVGGPLRNAGRNPYRPVLLGRVAASGEGANVRLHVERPNLWLAKMLFVGLMTILPIVFVAGVVGMLGGARTDQGASLVPFVVGPIAIAAFCIGLLATFRREARLQEQRLLTSVLDLLDAHKPRSG